MTLVESQDDRPAHHSFSVTAPLEVFRATPMQRIRLLKKGLRASDALTILGALEVPPDHAFKAVNVSRAAVKAKARNDEAVPLPEAERVLGVANLIGQVQQMVEESGEPEGFSASGWFSDWLIAPLPALGGTPPIELLDTMEGQEMLATFLQQMRGGAFA